MIEIDKNRREIAIRMTDHLITMRFGELMVLIYRFIENTGCEELSDKDMLRLIYENIDIQFKRKK